MKWAGPVETQPGQGGWYRGSRRRRPRPFVGFHRVRAGLRPVL